MQIQLLELLERHEYFTQGVIVSEYKLAPELTRY